MTVNEKPLKQRTIEKWHGSRLRTDNLRADLLAGVSGAIIVLPQGIAFATLAGLPPAYGLYAAVVPVVIAAFFGSSRHMVSGPNTAMSLVVFASISALTISGTERYVRLALILSLIMGLIQLAFGALKLGSLTYFISETVVLGFTTGAALLIAFSQLGSFTGIGISRGSSMLQIGELVASHVGKIHWPVFTVALVTMASAFVSKKLVPKFPYLISGLLAGAGIAYLFNFRVSGSVPLVHAIDSLWPPLSVPSLGLRDWQDLWPTAVALALLGLTSASSISRALALKTGQDLNNDKEFVAQGLSNVVGSFFSAFPSGGSFNRSAINLELGARSPWAAISSSLFLLLLLLVASPVLAFIPYAAMAGILFVVALSLIDLGEIRRVAFVSLESASIFWGTLLATLFIDLAYSVFIGVGLSLLFYLRRTSRPPVRSLIPDAAHPSRKLREVQKNESECPQFKIARVEGSIYFGAVHYVSNVFSSWRNKNSEQRHFLLMAKSINLLDEAGAELLTTEMKRRRQNGGDLYIYSLRESANRALDDYGFVSVLGEDHLFDRREDAIAYVFQKLDKSICASCPHRIFRECSSVNRKKRKT